MKTFAVKDQRSVTSSRVKNTSVHLPPGAGLRRQQAKIHQIVQPKLKVGQPNDRFEQEADRVADRVVGNQPVVDISSVSDTFTNSATQTVQADSAQEEIVQEPEIQHQAEEEEEQIQTKLLNRQAEEEEEDSVQAKGAIASAQATRQTVKDSSPGSPLRPDVRSVLESGMGVDLSAVRVHEDRSAHQAAASINARAFTHKNDIWLGEGQSQSDLNLMAHEATHVVQQRGGLCASSREISSATPRVQRLWNPVTAISNAVSSAVEWVGDTIGEAVDYIKERAVEFVSDMPGYSLFTVVNGSDPITGRRVERNGRNFIEAGLDVIPNGDALKQKLEQEGALEEAARWLDDQIRELDFSPTEIASQFASFWSSLSIADVTRLPTVVRRLANIITAPLGRILRFARNVAVRLLQIVKDYVISSLINFIREHTNAYPLLTVILERDPISNESVERTPIALLRGFMQLSESGQEQLRQMEESGSLQRAADWLNGAVARLNITWDVIRESFAAAWDLVTIQNLLDPIGTFRQLYNIFAGPVGRIVNFVIEIAVRVLGYIKDALINRLVAYARTVRGYPLITVILGRDPFSQEPVERTTSNIIRGFMSLMENGEQQYQEMEQSGAIARMSARVEAAMAMLNFTWEYIRGLFTRAWNSFSLQDLVAPFEAFVRLMAIFARPILRLINFVGEIIRVVIEVIMEVMNFPIDLIRNIISRAMQAIEDIKRDPIGFLKNLLRAVKTGFQQFFGNILRHLLNGLTGWLFSELRDANINPPADLSFGSILGFVLEVLGITVERIWQKLADRIGEERVSRIRGMIDRLTGIWTFVRDVATRGPVAIWEYIQERLSNLWNTVLEAVRNWVVTRIIERIVVRLLSMLDPTGIMAVVNGFIAFYNAVQSFIRYLREMLEIVNSFVVGVAEIARGNVTIAANFLEGSLSRAMPIAIGFLANQVGLSGIGRRIGEMIERVREMVDRALTWLVDRAVSAGTAFLNMFRRGAQDTSEGETGQVNQELQGAEAALDEAMQTSQSLDEVQAKFPRIQRQFNLRSLSIENIGTSNMHVKIHRNPIATVSRPNWWGRYMLGGEASHQAPFGATQDVTFGPVYRTQGITIGSTNMTVRYLGPNHPQGYQTGGRGIEGIMNLLVTQASGTQNKFVAGHLLNHDIGGPAEDENLFPITDQANRDHSNTMERSVKEWVNDNNYWVYYRVNVENRSVNIASRSGKDARNFVNSDFVCEAYPYAADGSPSNLRRRVTIRSRYQVPIAQTRANPDEEEHRRSWFGFGRENESSGVDSGYSGPVETHTRQPGNRPTSSDRLPPWWRL